jgi:membrane protease YdiL (CAAX protease family)
MIPDHDHGLGGTRPPLTLEFAFMLALLAPLLHVLCAMLLSLIGFRGTVPIFGMGAVLAYAGIFSLCALRFQHPPLQQLALVRAPVSAWLAVAFLASSVVLASEVDNWVKVFFPVPTDLLATPAEVPPYFATTFGIVEIAVFPLAYELFFRGILQPLAVARIGIVGGIVITAMLSGVASGLVFGGLWGVAPAIVLSLVLCVLRQASGSLWPPIALHALTGAVTLAAQFQVFGLPGFDDTTAPHTPLVWIVAATVSTAIGFALLWFASRDDLDEPDPPLTRS